MAKTRACDACAVRKIKCDGNTPCRGCIAASISCTRLKIHNKSGPKGPRQTTKHAISEAQREYKRRREASQPHSVPDAQPAQPVQPVQPVQYVQWPNFLGPSTFSSPADSQLLPESLGTLVTSRRIPLSSLRVYLDIYHHKLHPVWPVVRREELIARLHDPTDLEAYALATSVCAATIAQLKLPVRRDSDVESLSVDSSAMVLEAEQSRILVDYSEKPSLDILLSSYFLHVFYADTGRYHKSTLLLRESVTFAHILGLHLKAHYEDLNASDTQHHLRIVWLLFVTERYVKHLG